MGQTLSGGKERKKKSKRHENVLETYRAELDAPPQLGAVKIEVAIAPQREINLVVHDRI